MDVIIGWHGGEIRAFTEGVEFEFEAQKQTHQIAGMKFIHHHVAIMPDVHAGIGATVGSVIPTKGAIIPAAVGVDLGCGMMATRLSLKASDLPDNLSKIRSDIERTVPHGGPGPAGGWQQNIPNSITKAWVEKGLEKRFKLLCEKYPGFAKANSLVHLGTLGGGNHFIELCIDEEQRVWLMLHSGSRGIGNQIGRFFIDKAREMLIKRDYKVPDKDLAWFEEGEPEFDDYVEAVSWAQDFARINREMMNIRVLESLRHHLPPFTTDKVAVNCHHNYVRKEHHFGADIYVTRKGAVSAQEGELGIIPGSMGAKSFIVRGKGNADSFCSCSHGAGRRMSRTKAKAQFTVEDMELATTGVECRKDAGVIDEIPLAYKDVDAVMAAQKDLVDVVHVLKQVLCVKG